MAGREPSTTRRRVLGAAAALPVLALASPVRAELVEAAPERPEAAGSFDRTRWDRRLARYRRLAAEAAEAAETGWFREANDRFDRAMEALAPEAETLRGAAWKRMAVAEDAYWNRCTDPMQKAAIALVQTPAPDLAALHEKIAVIRAVQLHELEDMGRDCFEMLEEDVRRLERGPIA